MMNDQNWPKIEAILGEVLALPPEQREAALRSLSHESLEILAEVRAFLAAETLGEDLLGQPLVVPDLVKPGSQSPAIASRIGAYSIQRELGVGGMGRVYLANRADDTYQALVAIKILKRGMDSDEIVRRFHNERQILASLNHPHIARLLDGGSTESGDPYFVMEFVEGVALHEFTAHTTSLTLKLQLFQKICQAVHYAHQRSVIHRDLKPSNILVTQEGEPKLLDFGIAKILDPVQFSLADGKTETHVRLLTPKYASPEQFRREPVSTLSDVYNLGTLLYLVLTDTHPYWEEGLQEQELQERVCLGSPVPPISRLKNQQKEDGKTSRLRRFFSRSQDVDFSPDLNRIVLKAMHIEPERRYDSALAISHDLERFIAGRPIAARGDSTTYVLAKALKRHRKTILVGSLFFLLSMTFLFLFMGQKRDTHRERDLAKVADQRGNDLLEFTLGILSSIDPMQERRELATVAELANLTADQMEEKSLTDWHSRAILLEKLAEIYLNLGIYEKAYLLADKAFRLRINNQDPDHLDQAKTLLLIGKIAQIKPVWISSAGFFEEALVIAEAHYGKDHFELAPYISGLAGSRKGGRHTEKALAMSERAMALYDLADPQKPEVLATLLQTHGEILGSGFRFSEAETYLLKALDLRQTHLQGSTFHGLNHSSLGRLYQLWQRFPESVFHYKQALSIVVEKLGQNHVAVAQIMESLGFQYYLLYEFSEAETYFLQAINILNAGDESNRNRLAFCNYQLSNTYLKWGKYILAANYAEQSLKQYFPPDGHVTPNWILPLQTMTLAAIRMKALPVAERYNDEAYETLKQTYGLKHPLGLSVLISRCYILVKNNRKEEAIELQKQVLVMIKKHLENRSQNSAHALLLKASMERALDNSAAAESYLHQAIDSIQDEFGAEDPTLIMPLFDLTYVLEDQGRYAEAMQSCRQALGILECYVGPESQHISEAHELYDELERKREP